MNTKKIISPCRTASCAVYSGGKWDRQERTVSEEEVWNIFINGRYRGVITSSPHEKEVLAVGYAWEQGFVFPGQHVEWDCTADAVQVTASGNAVSPSRRRTFRVKAEQLCAYGNILDTLSWAHHASHGVHEGALVAKGSVIAYAEDVSRRNVLRRLGGSVIINQLDVSAVVLVFSGRVSKDVVEKANHIGVPCIAARAMATGAAIDAAEQLGLLLVCALRTDSFCVFSRAEKVIR